MHIFLRGNEVARVSETIPAAVGGYSVMELPAGMDAPAIGQIWDGEAFVEAPEPEDPPDPEVAPIAISPVAFKLLFTSAERIAITGARTYSGSSAPAKALKAGLDDLFSIIDDVRLTEIRLAHPAVSDGLAALVAAGILTEERATAIRANQTPG